MTHRTHCLLLACLLGCGGGQTAQVATPASTEGRVVQTLVPVHPSDPLNLQWAGDLLLVSNISGDPERPAPTTLYALDPQSGAVLAARMSTSAYAVAGSSVVTSEGIWDLHTDTVTPLALADVRQVAASQDGRWAARLSGRTRVTLVNVREATEQALYEGQGLRRIRFAGPRVLVSMRSETLVVEQSGEVALRLPCADLLAHGDPPRWICSDAQTVDVRDWNTGEETRHFEVPRELGWIHLARQQPDPNFIHAVAHGASEMSALNWNIESGELEDVEDMTDIPTPGAVDAHWRVAVSGCELTFEDEASDDDPITIMADVGYRDDRGLHPSLCSAFEIHPEGHLAAYGAVGKVYVLNAQTGATLRMALSSTLTECAGGESGTAGAMNTHGIVLPARVGLAHVCAPVGAPRDCAANPEGQEYPHCMDRQVGLDEPNGDRLGHSPSGRFQLVAGHAVGRDDDTEASDDDVRAAWVALRDTSTPTAEAVRVGTLQTLCYLARDQSEDGSWHAYYECNGGEGVVSDDGTRVYARDGSALLTIDVASGRTTRIELPGYEAAADPRTRLRLLNASVLLVSSQRHDWLVHLPSGRVLQGTAVIATASDDPHFAIVRTRDAIDIVDLATFEARRIEHVTSEEWRLSVDASTLVRVDALRPMQRIDVARAERLESAVLPAGYELDNDANELSPDGARIYGCIDGRWQVVELGTGTQFALARDCEGTPSWLDSHSVDSHSVDTGFLAIRSGAHAILHRMRDGARLHFGAVHIGERLVWTAHADGAFWAPTDALPELMVRDAGNIRAARTPLADSPHYDTDLLSRFIAPQATSRMMLSVGTDESSASFTTRSDSRR